RADRAAPAEAGNGDADRVHLPRRLERLHVAADRADRAGALHPAAGAGLTGTRTQRRYRADDGRLGSHRTAGAAAVPGAAAALPAGAVAGQREGVSLLQ